MANETNTPNNPRYLSCTEFVKIHPWPPMGGLRHLIFNAETNGFGEVVRRWAAVF